MRILIFEQAAVDLYTVNLGVTTEITKAEVESILSVFSAKFPHLVANDWVITNHFKQENGGMFIESHMLISCKEQARLSKPGLTDQEYYLPH